MNTKEKGDIAVGFAIAYFMGNNYEVCLPIGDKRPYDLVAERDGALFKVQIKFAGPWENGGPCVANLRTMGGNQSFYSAKKYANGAFDLLFVHTPKNNNYVIPWSEIALKSSIQVECGKYQRFRV